MGITEEQSTEGKIYLQKLTYAKSENECNEVYSKMANKLPQKVLDYYKSNWEPIREYQKIFRNPKLLVITFPP